MTQQPQAMAQTGRKLGPRAMRTRQRLLDATAGLLTQRSVLDISVVEIARAANTSPATFYHYFKDVEEAALVLAEQAAEETPKLVALVAGEWNGPEGLETAREIARRFIQHWTEHHAVLLIRNLAADKGDPRFQAARRMALTPFIQALEKRVVEHQQAGQVSGAIQPFAAAAALVSILEKLALHARDLQNRGVTPEALIETSARIVHQTVTGHAAD